MTRFGGNSIPGGEIGSMPSAVLLACQWVCQGKDNLCGGICVRFMLCLLNLKWQNFLSLLQLGAAVGVHPVHGLVQLRAADGPNATILDAYLNLQHPLGPVGSATADRTP